MLNSEEKANFELCNNFVLGGVAHNILVAKLILNRSRGGGNLKCSYLADRSRLVASGVL